VGQTRPVTVVLDAGALIALERGDGRMRALCREALRTGAQMVIPAGALGQVWRGGPRQAVLSALMSADTTRVPPLDRVLAQASGVLCARAGTSDVVDASVVLVARRERAVVITSDVDDLRALDPTLPLERI